MVSSLRFLFVGSIPKELGHLINLANALELNNNKLTGEIPSTLGGLKSVGWMMLSNNNLQGAVPASFCNLTSMDHVQLSHNPLLTCYPQCIFDAPAGPLSKLVTKNKDLDAGITACSSDEGILGTLSPTSALAPIKVSPSASPTPSLHVPPSAVPSEAHMRATSHPALTPTALPAPPPLSVGIPSSSPSTSSGSTAGSDGNTESNKTSSGNGSNGNMIGSITVIAIILLCMIGGSCYYSYLRMNTRNRARDFNLQHIKGLMGASSRTSTEEQEVSLWDRSIGRVASALGEGKPSQSLYERVGVTENDDDDVEEADIRPTTQRRK